jgi:uncharacterized paraquat-inducible protein A
VADASDLTRTRCHVHPHREAAARCPECLRFFCRECVTEHGERAMCGACLARLARGGRARRIGLLRIAGKALQVFIGVVTAWFFFYMVGGFLSSLPDTFHETSRGTGAVDGP